VRAATNDYQKESDILGEFLEEVTQAIPAAKVLKSELHDTYCQWARTTTDFREFNKKLASRGMKDIRIGAGMAWAELAIRPEFISKNWAV
jgi:phage/plasmid-associated DNA primase